MSKVGTAVDDVIDAVAPLSPDLAMQVLRFVLELAKRKGGLDTETPRRQYTAEELRAARPVPSFGVDPEKFLAPEKGVVKPANAPTNGAAAPSLTDQIVQQLVRDGHDPDVALKLAKRAIAAQGREAGLVVLMGQAKAFLAENARIRKERNDEAQAAAPAARDPSQVEPVIRFLETNPGSNVSQFARDTEGGLSRAHKLFALARDLGRIRMEGSRGKAKWYVVRSA